MGCDLCGKEGALFRAVVEESELTVCKNCGSYGKILKKIVPVVHRPKKVAVKKKEIVETLVSDFADKIKKARAKLEMTQEEFAKKIAEKESIVHKIESGSFKPSIPLAKKLQKILRVRLVEVLEEEPVNMAKGKSTALTIGDLIDFKD